VIVGVMRADLAIYDARTLKDKRQVVLSAKERIKNRFNVSVSEVGHGDAPKRCALGFAVVGNSARGLQSVLDQIVDVLRRSPGISLLEYECETY
jgi:hypothetical protein